MDIDVPLKWSTIYQRLFDELAPSGFWEGLLSSEDFGSIDSRIDALAIHVYPGTRERSYQKLRMRAREFFIANYTHHACYHACRIYEEAGYLDYGLRRCDIDAQNELAAKFFGHSKQLTDAIMKLRQEGYASHNHNHVGLFFARSGAIVIGEGYIRGGSEYLRRLANALGDDSRRLLMVKGRPALIRCELPLADLGDSGIDYAAMLPITYKLMIRDEIRPPIFSAIEGAFMHSADIPSNQITIEYLDAVMPN